MVFAPFHETVLEGEVLVLFLFVATFLGIEVAGFGVAVVAELPGGAVGGDDEGEGSG